MFAGDTIARGCDGRVILGVFNVDPAQATTSFKRQAGLAVQTACFGHGEPLIDGAADLLRASADQLPDPRVERAPLDSR